jgi:hypothetical protein
MPGGGVDTWKLAFERTYRQFSQCATKNHSLEGHDANPPQVTIKLPGLVPLAKLCSAARTIARHVGGRRAGDNDTGGGNLAIREN